MEKGFWKKLFLIFFLSLVFSLISSFSAFAATYSFETPSDYTVLKKQVDDPTGWQTCKERSDQYPATPAVKDISGQFYVGSECDSFMPNRNRAWRHYVSFNTSSIPDGETVTAAKFCAAIDEIPICTLGIMTTCRNYIDFELWSGSWVPGSPSWDSGNNYEGDIFPGIDDVPPCQLNAPYALNISLSSINKTDQTQLRLNVDDEGFCEDDNLWDIKDYVTVVGGLKLLVGTNGSDPGYCPGETPAPSCGACIPDGCGFLVSAPEPEKKFVIAEMPEIQETPDFWPTAQFFLASIFEPLKQFFQTIFRFIPKF